MRTTTISFGKHEKTFARNKCDDTITVLSSLKTSDYPVDVSHVSKSSRGVYNILGEVSD